jgi:hypothetical protein
MIRVAPKIAVGRVQTLLERDVKDLAPAFVRIAQERLANVKVELAKRGEAEAKLLAELLDQQRKRIAKATFGSISRGDQGAARANRNPHRIRIAHRQERSLRRVKHAGIAFNAPSGLRARLRGHRRSCLM